MQRFRHDLTTIDPIGNVAIFAGLTASLTRAERHRTALRASLYAAVILVVAVVAGQIILDAIGIRLHSLKVAGGIILFLFALQMLFGGLDSNPGSPEPGRDLAVFPLAVPSIAGPGAMMAVIVLTDNDVYTVPEQAETGVFPLTLWLAPDEARVGMVEGCVLGLPASDRELFRVARRNQALDAMTAVYRTQFLT